MPDNGPEVIDSGGTAPVQKPSRPPPPVARPPPPKILEPPPRPATPKNRRERGNPSGSGKDVELPEREAHFPFKSHFEKKSPLPSPRKAIKNLLKGVSKEERLAKKEQEQIQRLIETVDQDILHQDLDSDEWKQFQALTNRIQASVEKTQENIQNLEAAEKTQPESSEVAQERKWTNFEQEESGDPNEATSEPSGLLEDEEDLLGLREPVSESAAFGDAPDLMEGTTEDVNNENGTSEVKEGALFELDTEDTEEHRENLIKDIDDFLGVEEKPKPAPATEEPPENTFDPLAPLQPDEPDNGAVNAEPVAAKPFDFSADDGGDATLLDDQDGFMSSGLDAGRRLDSVEAFGKLTSTEGEDCENPFGDSEAFTAAEIGTTSSRPRPKATRQETLSGNNPFRGSEESADGPDIAEPLAAISGAPERSPIEVEGEKLVSEVVSSSFDPLATIYPESDSDVDDEERGFSVTIRAGTTNDTNAEVEAPKLEAPPCKPDGGSRSQSPRFNPFDAEEEVDSSLVVQDQPVAWGDTSSETPAAAPDEGGFAVDWAPTKKDVELAAPPSPEMEFEPFRIQSEVKRWKLFLRMPEKKKKGKQFSKYTSNRYWKEMHTELVWEEQGPALRLFHTENTDEPYRTIRFEPYLQLSRDKLQQYDKFGKLHIFKVNYIEYKELVGMRTEKFSLSKLTSLVSHKPKSNMVFDHVPMRTEILKFGSMDQSYLRALMSEIDDALMNLSFKLYSNINYTKEEVCSYVHDEYEARLASNGHIEWQQARVRLFFAAFVNETPYVILGLNDKRRFGKEVVRRSDIIPVMHDEWITIHKPEFHSAIDRPQYETDHLIRFNPMPGCRFEMMRFRVSLRENKELPLVCNCKFSIDDATVEIRCDLMVPGFYSNSKRHGQVACNDIEVRIPIPEDWIYYFRQEGRFKYTSVHSALRRPGRIKGLERITQMASGFFPPSMLEADCGVAKYEHLYKSIVWRVARLPEKHHGAYKTHLLTCKLELGTHDTIPEWDKLEKSLHVEYTMPASTVSGTTIRSISVDHPNPPEKFVKYIAKFAFDVGIEYELGERKAPPLKSILDDLDGVEAGESEENKEQTEDGEAPMAKMVLKKRKKEDEEDLKNIKFEDLADLSDRILEESKTITEKTENIIQVDSKKNEEDSHGQPRPKVELKLRIDSKKYSTPPPQQNVSSAAPIAVHDDEDDA